MKIKILSILPQHWVAEDLNDNLKISYVTKYRFKPKSVLLPKTLEIDENFIEAMGLYLGDGSFQKNKSHLTFTNKDKDICKFILQFFRERFFLNLEDFSCQIKFKAYDKNILQNWYNYLGLPKDKIKLKYYYRNKDETFHLQINRTILRQIFEILTQKIMCSDFLENIKSRRAFMRGLFAAEGSIGLSKSSPKQYINYISFNLSYYEHNLINLIETALRLENIKFKTMRDISDHSTEIRITGWDNYWKLWQSEIFNRCERKTRRFFEVAKNLEVNFLLKPKFRKLLFSENNLRQKDMAIALSSWQGNVSKMKSGVLGITTERLINLAKTKNISLNKLCDNITHCTVGRLTRIHDKEFIKKIITLKSI